MKGIEPYIAALRGPVLVTGASGFVGANLYHMLSRERNDIFAVVRHDKGWRLSNVKNERTVAVDLNDYAATKNLIETFAPQTVFNCAAYGAYSFEEDQDLIYQTNFLSVVNMVGMLSKIPFSAFIHAGSSSEYGSNCSAPSEDARCDPNSPYAVSKVAVANYLRYMGKQHSFPTVNLRLYSVYGPLEDTSRLLPSLVKKASEGDLPALVDPLTSRDFVYIDDVCQAFILAAAKMQPGIHGESFNIGSGTKTTIGELVEVARQIFRVEKIPVFNSMEGRRWDLPDWYSNPSKAQRELGWSATTSLEVGLQLTSKWVSTLNEDALLLTSKLGLRQRRRSVSAIIACYKDAQAIPYMYSRLTKTLKKLDVNHEIIFVNDGSPDESAEVIKSLSKKDPCVIGICHSRNFGSQMAFRSGMEISIMDSVVLLDGDLQDPPELIEDFYAKWEEGFDVVFGRRVKREMPLYRSLMYKTFYRLFDKLSYIRIPLDAGDFSLIDRRVVGWILNSPERDLFVRGLRAYVGFRQTGVNYERPERMFGRTTNSFIKNVDWAKKAIFSFSNTPITTLTNAGIVCLAISFLAAFVVAFLRIFIPDIAPRGATTLLIGIILFGSVNLFAIGLLGEYVSKIMIEVKQRPRLIRSALIRNGEITELLPDGKALLSSSSLKGNARVR
jgi:nucleoside-diphosphate-sugar epimerase/glycosyltransferase involved in cell wall biosynthesis